jgi:hypothetical protein
VKESGGLMKDLPEFRRFSHNYVIALATQIMTHPNQPDHSYFRRLVEYEDGHYAAVFGLEYFGASETPTKSQWNSLKKKFKRHDKRIFVFKEHTLEGCGSPDDDARCGAVEFGFFAHDNLPPA